MPRIALIHALAHSVAPVADAFERLWPQARRMNLLDDSLSADLASQGRGLDAAMHRRFEVLADYAVDAGADALLFTCSAFGACIEAVARRHGGMPVLKPNEAMVAAAVQHPQACAGRIGLVASFAPTLASMPGEFPAAHRPATALAEGALDALNRGDTAAHDHAVALAARRLRDEGCTVIALAQFSLARAAQAAAAETGLPVFTTPDSAVEALRRRLD